MVKVYMPTNSITSKNYSSLSHCLQICLHMTSLTLLLNWQGCAETSLLCDFTLHNQSTPLWVLMSRMEKPGEIKPFLQQRKQWCLPDRQTASTDIEGGNTSNYKRAMFREWSVLGSPSVPLLSFLALHSRSEDLSKGLHPSGEER